MGGEFETSLSLLHPEQPSNGWNGSRTHNFTALNRMPLPNWAIQPFLFSYRVCRSAISAPATSALPHPLFSAKAMPYRLVENRSDNTGCIRGSFEALLPESNRYQREHARKQSFLRSR